MSAIPLARYLVEFGSEGDSGTGPAILSRAPSRSPPQDVEAGLAESYARGLREGKAAGEAECTARLDTQARAFEQTLAAEREAWSRSEGAMLAERLRVGLRTIETDIGNAAARILQPFLSAEVRQRAVDELRRTLAGLLAGQPAARIEISGPDDLLAAFRTELSDTIPGVTFTPGSTCDVRVTIDQTVLETNLGAWMKTIEEAVP